MILLIATASENTQNRTARLSPATAIPLYCSFAAIPQHQLLVHDFPWDQYNDSETIQNMVLHHNYSILCFYKEMIPLFQLKPFTYTAATAKFHSLFVTFLLKPWFIAPAKLVSTGLTCMAFLLLGPMLLCLQILSEVLMYATFTEPVAINTTAFNDTL